MKFLDAVLPSWVRWLALLLICALIYTFGCMHGERRAGERHIEYVSKQAGQTVKIARAQTKVVIETEIKWRDRIQKIYVQGDVIEKEVPNYVTAADNAGCTINAGFVRIYDAAWAGEPAGPVADFDRGPSGISLAEVGETDAFNAKVARAWREQALGWREYYQKLKTATADASSE